MSTYLKAAVVAVAVVGGLSFWTWAFQRDWAPEGPPPEPGAAPVATDPLPAPAPATEAAPAHDSASPGQSCWRALRSKAPGVDWSMLSMGESWHDSTRVVAFNGETNGAKLRGVCQHDAKGAVLAGGVVTLHPVTLEPQETVIEW